ncbi:glutamate receptor-like isoform X2 [Tachypleus tridentatus]
MIGMLHRNEADIAIGPFIPNYDRYQITQFSTPLSMASLAILTGQLSTVNDYFAFLRVFEPQVWLAAIVSLVLVSFATALLNTARQGWKQRETEITASGSPHGFLNNLHHALWTCFTSHMNQGITHQPGSLHGRLLFGFWILAVFVVMCSFGGQLLSSMLIGRNARHINSLEDLRDFKHITPVIYSGGATEALFKFSNQELYQDLWKRMKLIPNKKEVVDQVLNDVQTGTHVLITDISSIVGIVIQRYNEAPNEMCTFRIAPKTFYNMPYVLCLSRNLDKDLSKALQKQISHFVESHVIYKLLEDRSRNNTKCVNREHKESVSALGISNMMGIFGLLCLGHGISLIFLATEVIFFKVVGYHKHNQR